MAAPLTLEGTTPGAVHFIDVEGECARDVERSVWCRGRVTGTSGYVRIEALGKADWLYSTSNWACAISNGQPARCISDAANHATVAQLLPVEGIPLSMDSRSCAVDASGNMRCLDGPTAQGVRKVRRMHAGIYLLEPSGTLRFVSKDEEQPFTTLQNVTDFDIETYQWCAIRSGQVTCGIHDGPEKTVMGLSDATAIAMSNDRACALRTGGTLSCWALHPPYDDETPYDQWQLQASDAGVEGVMDFELDYRDDLRVVLADGRILFNGELNIPSPVPVATLPTAPIDLWSSREGLCIRLPDGERRCLNHEISTLHTPTSESELSVPYPFRCQQKQGTFSTCQVKDGPKVTLPKGSGVFQWMPCGGDIDGIVQCLNVDGTLLDVRTLLPAGTGAVYELHTDVFAETPNGRMRLEFDQDEGYQVDDYQSMSFEDIDYAFAKSGGKDANLMGLDATFSLSTGRPTGQGCGVVDRTLYCWADTNNGQSGLWGSPHHWSVLHAVPGATANRSLGLHPAR